MNRQIIALAGMNAAARGEGIMANPYFRAENMPRKTGDSFEIWQEKIALWEGGWREYHEQQEERLRSA